MKRRKAGKSDKRAFSSSAGKTHSKNLYTPRGGYRL